MVILSVGTNPCGRCNSHVEKCGFMIADGRGSSVFLCLLHVVEELELCCDHRRVVGEEC